MRVKDPSVWLQVREGGWIEITAEGDCCSDAFIDAVRLRGTPTLTGEMEEISFLAAATTQEMDEVTAVCFRGERGSVTIVHRNSSNGYYGNYLVIRARGEPPADAVDGAAWFRTLEDDQQGKP